MLEQYQKDQITLIKSIIKQMVDKTSLDRNDCVAIIDKIILKVHMNLNNDQYQLIINQTAPATSAVVTRQQLARRIYDVPELKDGICNYFKN